MNSPYDLSFVAPRRREEVRRRIDAVQRYVDGRGSCRDIAAELGMPPRSLRVLARALRRTGDPLQLPGVRTRAPRPTDMTPEQMAILREALEGTPGEVLQDAAKAAERIARERGIPLPTRTTVRARMTAMIREMPERLPSADLVLDHVVLGMPTTDAEAGRTPLLTAVIDVRLKAPVGLALSPGRPTAAAAARALANALERIGEGGTEGGAAPTIDVTALEDADRRMLEPPLIQAGLRVDSGELIHSRTGRTFRRIVGARFGSFAIRTVSVWSPDRRSLHGANSIQQPIPLTEAEALLRARMIKGIAPPARHRMIGPCYPRAEVEDIYGLIRP